jgi:predicted acylesterase/phospholipase RssA
MNIPYSGLCLGAGSAGGYYTLGALHYLYTSLPERMSQIKYYTGTSVGSIIVTMLAIGYTPMELFSYICKFDIGMVLNPNLDFKKAFETWGMISSQTWTEYLTSMVVYKWNQRFQEYKVPTYKEVYDKTGNIIICPSYKIHPNPEKIYSNPIQTPNLSIVDGMRMSSCIPGVFEKCEIEDSLYIDGAFFDSCPAEYLLNLLSPQERFVCIRFSKSNMTKMENITDYFKRIVYVFEMLQPHQGTTSSQCDDIIIKTEIGQLTLNVDLNKRIQYFNQGKIQTQNFLLGKEKTE